MSDYDDDIEIAEATCPKCGHHAYTRPCYCDEGFSHHDCFDDSCCCADPEPNVRCRECRGRGQHVWCRRCGWDLLEKRFLNGHDERTAAELLADRGLTAV